MLGVTVAKKGRIVFSASASSVPDMDVLHPEDTILRIYSMTKPITSVAALMLTGRVHVGQVEKYLIVYLCFGGPVAVFILVTDVSSGLFYQDAKRWRYWVLG